MDRWILLFASACYAVSFLYTVYAIRCRHFQPPKINLLLSGAGFVFLSVYLYFRGQTEGACPLTSLSDVLVFLAWATVLIYLLIGGTYRLSLMGAFTAPLVLLLLAVAFFLGDGRLAAGPGLAAANSMVELHAALSLVAYGAFGLAAVASGMYLLQERLLKKHRISSLMYSLPPIQALSDANFRLLVAGFFLLTLSFFAGVAARMPVGGMKILAAVLIWFFYGLLLFRRMRKGISPRMQSVWTLGIFLFVIGTLPFIYYWSSGGGGR